MQGNSPLGCHSVITPKVYLGLSGGSIHSLMTQKPSVIHVSLTPWDWKKGIDTHEGAGQAGFRVTWPGLPPCWLARFPKQDVPSCSHRAHRWLTTCFWQDSFSLVPGYCSAQSCKIYPQRVPTVDTVAPHKITLDPSYHPTAQFLQALLLKATYDFPHARDCLRITPRALPHPHRVPEMLGNICFPAPSSDFHQQLQKPSTLALRWDIL